MYIIAAKCRYSKKLIIFLTIILISGCDFGREKEKEKLKIKDEVELLEVNKERIVSIKFEKFFGNDGCDVIIDLEYGGKTELRLYGASCRAFIMKSKH